MKLLQLLIILILSGINNTANANIIRDSEIEEAVNLVIDPLRRASGPRL